MTKKREHEESPGSPLGEPRRVPAPRGSRHHRSGTQQGTEAVSIHPSIPGTLGVVPSLLGGARLAVLGPSCFNKMGGPEGGMGSKACIPSPGAGRSACRTASKCTVTSDGHGVSPHCTGYGVGPGGGWQAQQYVSAGQRLASLHPCLRLRGLRGAHPLLASDRNRTGNLQSIKLLL